MSILTKPRRATPIENPTDEQRAQSLAKGECPHCGMHFPQYTDKDIKENGGTSACCYSCIKPLMPEFIKAVPKRRFRW